MVRKQFSESQQEAIRDAIAAAELNTSGEIRVHIDKVCKKDPIERAIEMFAKLGMHKTELKNGVLFFVSMENHKLAIIGDKGINEAVTADFWDSIRDEMIQHFKQGLYTEGLV
ncbi:MAG: TPM domain-containing protein, partial [Crocinitomicaceae bacterium]|nr:TPM domain-containing protein [Crocinitomicaceae bacterium]MDP5011574.1 TPM domain-containing protein [Crocinitomicaceae bacterium]MDP5099033.1 TPM domain-containing protein [Crocinitomicaceae bacterium]